MSARYISVQYVSSSGFQLTNLHLYTLHNTLFFSFCADLNLASLSLSLSGEAHKLKVFESRVPKKTSAPKGKRNIKKGRKLHENHHHHHHYSSSKRIRVIKSRTMPTESSVEHVRRLRNAQKVLVTRLYGKTECRDLGKGGIILK